MQKKMILLGAIFAGTAVILGAFGAHALRDRLAPDQLLVFETGVRYQMYHALALFAVAWMSERKPGRAAAAAGRLFVAGIVLFSGSLYLLATRDLTGAPAAWLGPVTPLGGLCFIAGWAALAVAVSRGRDGCP
ncbi:MAG TPA: DUF423 domain-containing protein [Kiritimatiellia bacterium]|jgi:uncharacterized membrane protein YgdD (TMEM256/DUF423 family)